MLIPFRSPERERDRDRDRDRDRASRRARERESEREREKETSAEQPASKKVSAEQVAKMEKLKAIYGDATANSGNNADSDKQLTKPKLMDATDIIRLG